MVDHIWPVALVITYIIKEQVFNSGFQSSVYSGGIWSRELVLPLVFIIIHLRFFNLQTLLTLRLFLYMRKLIYIFEIYFSLFMIERIIL